MLRTTSKLPITKKAHFSRFKNLNNKSHKLSILFINIQFIITPTK